eukprot:10861491-Alexandrium_andersonii.AAC.1
MVAPGHPLLRGGGRLGVAEMRAIVLRQHANFHRRFIMFYDRWPYRFVALQMAGSEERVALNISGRLFSGSRFRHACKPACRGRHFKQAPRPCSRLGAPWRQS